MSVVNTVQYAFDGTRGNVNVDVYRFFTYTAAGVYADESTKSRTFSTSDTVTIDNSVGACWYISAASGQEFNSLLIYCNTPGVTGTVSLICEYWNGVSWTGLPFGDPAAPVNLTVANNAFDWDIPADWADTDVNGTTARWIRFRVIAAFSTPPGMKFISVGRTMTWTKTIRLPHDSMEWKSAYLDWSAYINNRFGSVKFVTVYGRLGAAGAWTRIVGPIIGYPGSDSQQSVRSLVDLIPLFKLSWPGGASVSLELRFSLCATTQNAGVDYYSDLAGRVTCTYQYEEDEANDTLTKTVRIPLRSFPPGMTTSEQLVDQIPVLDTWLPESEKVIRDWWIEFEGNNCNLSDSTSVYGFRARVGSLSSQLVMNCSNSTAKSSYHWAILSLMGASSPILPSNEAHDVYMRSTQANNLNNQANAVVYVTYNYSKAATTRTIQSLVVPLGFTSMPLRTSDPTNYNGAQANVIRPIWVQEPGEITVKKSAIRIIAEEMLYGEAAQSIRVSATGDTSFTAYPTGPRENPAGQFSIMHPLNSLTLNRGKNFVGITTYSQYTDYLARGRSHVLYLNYESDVHPDGEWRHNRTIMSLLMNMSYVENTWATYNPFCPMGGSQQTSYFINDASMCVYDTGVSAQAMSLVATVYSDTSQHYALQWNLEHAGPVKWLSTEHTSIWYIPVPEWFSQVSDGVKPITPATGRLRPYIGNGYGVVAVQNSLKSCVGMMTFHCCSNTVSGKTLGFPGEPQEVFISTTDVNDMGCQMKPATVSPSGEYTVEWPEDTADVYLVAHFSGKKYGVTQRNKAGN